MPGADGQLRIYGDGTAGALTITDDVDWSVTPPTNDNYQFTNVTIAAGATLTVPSGTVVRTTGTFTNNGLIVVEPQANPGYVCLLIGGGTAYVVDPAADAFGNAAGQPNAAATGSNALSGVGYGVDDVTARLLIRLGIVGGGGGSGNGGRGGGAFTVLSAGTLSTAAGSLISAPGEDATATSGCALGGGGGGGGGIVVLASRTQITMDGDIDVRGGNGGDSRTYAAAGGGGSGGIGHLLAPTVTTTGGIYLTGGALGSTATAVTGTPRLAGGAGGSSARPGGKGYDLNTSNQMVNPSPAQDGAAYISVVDPTAML